MKKLIAFLLIAALILPSACLADDSDVVGVWLYSDLLNTGAPSMAYIYLAEDHTCYYAVQAFNTDSPGFGRQYVGTWDKISSDKVYVKTGENTSTILLLAGDYAVAETTLDIYCHVPVLNLSDYLDGKI